MQAFIFVTTQFTHFHRWPDAPEKYAYLGRLHRHVFHVQMMLPVTELNRQIEFIEFKEHLNYIIAGIAQGSYPPHNPKSPALDWSCETWCAYLLECFPNASFCGVFEDGENGAVLARTMQDVEEAMKIKRVQPTYATGVDWRSNAVPPSGQQGCAQAPDLKGPNSPSNDITPEY